MERAFGLDIPQTLNDVCDPARLVLVVYDMQVGIVKQIENGQQITDRVLQVLDAARGLELNLGIRYRKLLGAQEADKRQVGETRPDRALCLSW
jgi:isochorismate hydrolase